MRPVVTPDEARRLDAASPEPVEALMERAGYGVAAAAIDMGAGYGSRVVVLAGTGNNGGDGYVAARYLARRGAKVVVHALGYPRGDDAPARHAAIRARHAGVEVRPLGPPQVADLVIDALFGVGFHGTLPDPVVPWTEVDVPVLAVDVPSGIDAATGEVRGPAFTAERTVTFHVLKTGHLLGEGPDHCGEVTVVDIGLEGGLPSFLLCEEQDAPVPVRPRTAHKWSAGAVAVVGGWPGLTGAAALAARGALHAGAGASAVICPRASLPVYETLDAGLLKVGVGEGRGFRPEDADAVLEAAARYDVLVVGPGLGPVDPAFLGALVAGWPGPLVIDADGINRLPGPEALDRRRGRPTLLTPHAGELRRLLGGEATASAAGAFAAERGVTILLKGNPTFVFGEERWIVTSGGPELATIGTGDVLAGMIAARAAAGLPLEVAARSAAYSHGVAGRRLAARSTVTATALLAEIALRG